MNLKNWFKRFGLLAIVILIGLLLLVNIYMMYQNHLIIEHNKNLQEKAEQTKVNTVNIISNLHLLDMGLRSYALVRKAQFLSAIEGAYSAKDSIFRELEKLLLDQHYPMTDFYALKDSIGTYYGVVDEMRADILNNRHDHFLQILDKDPGYRVWLMYQDFAASINRFEDNIAEQAKARYERAIARIYVLQIILFLITVPTLAYTAYYTAHAFNISEQLRKSEEDNARALARQNETLEHLVRERTNEILLQNEEISAQHEEIISHNEQLIMQQREIETQSSILAEQNRKLQNANGIIEEQNRVIQKKNEELSTEVERQTQDLKKTNLELLEQNSRLEQFAYIISHNLRAPLARLVGLANLFDRTKNREENSKIVRMIVASTTDLDHIIKDLSNILKVQKSNTQVLKKVNLSELIEKITRMLTNELEETGTTITTDFGLPEISNTLPQYIESILYNLISNAIKYRHPERAPLIEVKSAGEGEYIKIEVSDNGLGLDLDKYKESLFSLYKRFHFHVEGKGLGLYLVKTQVGALGGRIEVASEIGKGTTFIIYLKR